MIENNNYKFLAENMFDEYRDLDKVFADDFCKKNNFNPSNTLLVDSHSKLLQLWLQNSLTASEYNEIEVNKGDDEWQKNHMDKIANFIIEMLDNCDDVPDYLKRHTP